MEQILIIAKNRSVIHSIVLVPMSSIIVAYYDTVEMCPGPFAYLPHQLGKSNSVPLNQSHVEPFQSAYHRLQHHSHYTCQLSQSLSALPSLVWLGYLPMLSMLTSALTIVTILNNSGYHYTKYRDMSVIDSCLRQLATATCCVLPLKPTAEQFGSRCSSCLYPHMCIGP